MLPYIKSFFIKPSPLEAAMKELQDAKMLLLEANTGKDYVTSVVSFNEKRIKRLEDYIIFSLEEEKEG